MFKIACVLASALCVGTLASMRLNVLKEALNDGARCLDGTAPGYYFKEGTTEKGRKNWVLFIQGGGWCYKETDCYERSNTNMGSSNQMVDEISDGGPLDGNKQTTFLFKINFHLKRAVRPTQTSTIGTTSCSLTVTGPASPVTAQTLSQLKTSSFTSEGTATLRPSSRTSSRTRVWILLSR